MDSTPKFRSPQIFIGAPLDVTSEVQVLRALVDGLSVSDPGAVVLANVELGDRQIDFIVCTNTSTVVVEVKAYRWRVEGQENGDWLLHLGQGRTLVTRNAYRQALDAKNRWKDWVNGVIAREARYPNACVVVVPTLPAGSSIPTFQKVGVFGLPDLLAFLGKPCQQRLSEVEVATLVSAMKLVRVESVDEAADESLLVSRRRIDAYVEQFRRLYGQSSRQLMTDSYVGAEGPASSDEVARQVLGRAGAGTVIRGPSGCGKSLLCEHLLNTASNVGYVPVLLQAQYFEGELRKSLDREAGLLSDTSAKTLLGDLRRLEVPWVLCVDGYNECPSEHRLTLTRSVAALAKRYRIPCLFSSQGDLERPDLIDCATVEVLPPSMGLKLQIAQSVAGSTATERLERVLSALVSGLEARLAGEVAAELPAGGSSHALFDTYVRKSLGDFASEGIGTLAQLAGALTDGARFSTSVRELDRLVHDLKASTKLVDTLVRKKVLTRHGDRVSFGHELFFRAFAAEWAARTRMKTRDEVLSTLASPRYSKSKESVLALIEDDVLLEEVLAELTDEGLLYAAYVGKCGEAARHLVRSRCRLLLDGLKEEPAKLEFVVSDAGISGVSCIGSDVSSWTAPKTALLGLVARLVAEGEFLEPAFAAVRAMDDSIMRAYRTLSLNVDAQGRAKLMHALFQECYVMGGRASALTRLITAVCSGAYSIRFRPTKEFATKVAERWTSLATPGEQYLAMSMLGHTHDTSELVSERLAQFFENMWPRAPYHLRLAALNFATYAGPADATRKARLVRALEKVESQNIFLQSSIVEALEALGAFEHEKWDQVAPITSELKELLATPEEPASWDAAANLFMRQFDHPFSDAYCQAWHELSDGDRGLLSAMACRGTDPNQGFFTFASSTIRNAIRAGPTPFVVETVLARLTPPVARTGNSQESIETFLIAHEALGELGAAIPDVDWTEIEQTPGQVAVLACARMLYAHALPQDQANMAELVLRAAKSKLFEVGGAQALAAIATLQWGRAMAMSRECMVVKFPEECLALARIALDAPAQPVWHLEPHLPANAHTDLGLSILSQYGGREDISRLRRYVDQPELGERALDAIQRIDARQ